MARGGWETNMRLFLIASCAFVAISASALLAGAKFASAKVGPAGDVSVLMGELAKLPEGKLRTRCVFADPYRHRRITSDGYGSSPEYRRYLQCLLSEARRGGGVRLASASSFAKIGTCYPARITAIGGRFGGPPDRNGGTTVAFDIGLSLVDYGLVRPVARSRVGDRVRVCVHDLPEDCPGNDLRGIGYRTRNLRTGESWIMGDSQHGCRGA
jgi:hypothetical protein